MKPKAYQICSLDLTLAESWLYKPGHEYAYCVLITRIDCYILSEGARSYKQINHSFVQLRATSHMQSCVLAKEHSLIFVYPTKLGSQFKIINPSAVCGSNVKFIPICLWRKRAVRISKNGQCERRNYRFCWAEWHERKTKKVTRV